MVGGSDPSEPPAASAAASRCSRWPSQTARTVRCSDYRLQIHDLILGLVVFPAVMAAVGLIGRRYARRPLRFTGPLGLLANTAVIVALFVTPYTAGAAALFYGTSLLIAARRALPGCEATVVSNLLLHRDDQIGCPTFTPIDALEARSHSRRIESPTGT